MALKTKSTFYGLVEQNGPWTLTRKDKERLRQRDPLFLGGGNPAGGRAHAGHASWLVTTGYPHRSDGFSKQAEILNYPKAEKGPDYRSIVSKGSDYRNRVKYNKGVFGIPPGGSPFLKGDSKPPPGPGSSLQPPSGFFPVQGLAPGSAPAPMEQMIKKEEPMVIKAEGAMDEEEFQDIMNDNDLADVTDVPAESMTINNVDNGVVLATEVTETPETTEQVAEEMVNYAIALAAQIFPDADGVTSEETGMQTEATSMTDTGMQAEPSTTGTGTQAEPSTTGTGMQATPSTTGTGMQAQPSMKSKKISARARDLVAEAVAKDPYTYVESIGPLTGNPVIDAVTVPKEYASKQTQANSKVRKRTRRTQTNTQMQNAEVMTDEVIIDQSVNNPVAAARVPSVVTNNRDAEIMTDLTGVEIADRVVYTENLQDKVARLELAAEQSAINQRTREYNADLESQRRVAEANIAGYAAGRQEAEQNLNREINQAQLRGEQIGTAAGYERGFAAGANAGAVAATEATLNAAVEVLRQQQLPPRILTAFGLQYTRPANFSDSTLQAIDTVGATYGEGPRSSASLSARSRDDVIETFSFQNKKRRRSAGTSPISTTPIGSPPSTPREQEQEAGPSGERGRSPPAARGAPAAIVEVFRSGGEVKVRYENRPRALKVNGAAYKKLVRDGIITPVTAEQFEAARSPTR